MSLLQDRSARWLAFFTLLLGVVLWAGPGLVRPDLFDDDAAQHIYWLYRYATPQLFPGDVSVEYFRTSAPLGYRALYAVAAHSTDALLASKLVAVLLLLGSGALAWAISQAVPGECAALRGLYAVTALVLFIVFTRHSGGVFWNVGFQRTFALPLILGCLWGLLRRAYPVVGLSWIGAALFYPVILPVMGIATGIVVLADWRRGDRMFLPVVLLVACGIAALLLALKGLPTAPGLGPAYTYGEAVSMPEFGFGGRLQLHAQDLVGDMLRFHMMGLGWPPLPLLAIVAATAIVTWRARHLLPLPVWAVLGSGVALWGLMRLFPEKSMFDLYLPNRHARWAIAAFGTVATSSAGALVVATLLKVLRGSPAIARTVHVAALLAAPGIVALFFVPAALEQRRQAVDHDLENVYTWLGTLPTDVVIAAHPDLADYIPLRSRREVLASTEESMPWLKGYYAIMKPRVEASLRAAYAPDMSSFDTALRGQGADVFVTGPPVWRKSGYFEPYNDEVQLLLRTGRERGFALQSPPADRVLFRSGDYYVLKVARE